jgi:outer membrane protein OmpA-like peptidoglycan-associated protein
MKILLPVFLTVFFASRGYSQDYFIVVGAFAKNKEAYAQRFVESLKKDDVSANYVEDTKRNILLVYVEKFEEYQPSISEMLAVRKQGKFPEAWVRIMKDNPRSEVPEPPVTQVTPTPGVTSPPLGEVKEPQEQELREPETPVTDSVSTITPGNIIRSEPVTIVIPGPKKDTPVIFHLYDANDNDKIVEGSIEIVDTQRARLIQTAKSTDTVSLPNPNSDTGTLSLITDVFGYRKVQHEVNYKQPVADSTKLNFDLEGDHFVARFEMVRYHKGDIATLYHVFFFNDAAIMMPESKYELNKLLDMMKSNPRYRIMLHGHTNGNSRGRIVSMGPSKAFFSLNAPDVKEGSGSSKELSGQRAEVIKEWLISEGIAADRMEVKAWGGKRMLHDKNSTNARKNVRVEVEVLDE